MLYKSRVKIIHLPMEENERKCLILSPYATVNVFVSLVFVFLLLFLNNLFDYLSFQAAFKEFFSFFQSLA